MTNHLANTRNYRRSPIHSFVRNSAFTIDLRRHLSPRKKSFFGTLLHTTKKFCRQTTIHGLKNIVESIDELEIASSRYKWKHCIPTILKDPKNCRSIICRSQRIFKFIKSMFWTLTFLASYGFAVNLMYIVWRRNDSTPFITTIESTSYPIWNVPFPAVTVCNINKVYRPATIKIKTKLYD